MRTLAVFESVSLDGFFKDASGGNRWAHRASDPEMQEFVAHNAGGGGDLLFGRKTYDEMAAFWPTPEAARQMPAVANRMTAAHKHVVSRTLTTPGWQNVQVHAGLEQVHALLATDGPAVTILGSGSLAAQLADRVDTWQLLVIPIVLGAGTTVFGAARLDLKLASTRAFKNGNVYLTYTRS